MRGWHWLCRFGRPPEGTQRRPAGAGERGSRGAGDRGPTETGKGNWLNCLRQTKGKGKVRVRAIGMGTPIPGPGRRWGLLETPCPRAVRSLAAATARSVGNRQPGAERGPSEWTRFGGSSSSLDFTRHDFCLLVCALRAAEKGMDYRQSWALFLGKGL